MPISLDNKALEAPVIGPGSIAAPVTPANNLVVTSGPAKQQFAQTSSDLSKMLATLNQQPVVVGAEKDTPSLDNTNDAYTQTLDRIAGSSDEATKALVSSIQAGRQNQKNSVDSTYENYKSGLQLLGIQHNEAQATPDLLMGHIQQAENEHQAKITQLDIETNKALMDAKKAETEGKLSILKEKMAYVKQLKDEKNNYLKNIADQMTAQKTIADVQAGQYYDALEKLNPADKEKFLIALAKKNNLPVGSLVDALTKEKERRDDRDLTRADKLSTMAARNKTAADVATAKITFGQPDIQALTLAGIPTGKIKELEKAINDPNIGLEKVLTHPDLNDAQRAAIKKVLGAASGTTSTKDIVAGLSSDVQANLDSKGFITAAGLAPLLSKIQSQGGDVFDALKELKPYLNTKHVGGYNLPKAQKTFVNAL